MSPNQSTYYDVKIPHFGSRSRRVGIVALAVSLVFLTSIGGILPVLPGLVDAFYGTSSNKSATTSASLVNPKRNPVLPAGPGVSLPPGTIQAGSKTSPTFSKAVDSAIQPHLSLTSDGFEYQTSFGVYSFNRTLPFVFSLRSLSGTPLTRQSLFFVIAEAQDSLRPGGANVTVANEEQFQVRYSVVLGSVPVGNLLLRVDFQSHVRPKFTISFSTTQDWTFGNFNIVWATFPAFSWLRVANSRPVDLSNSIPKGIANVSRVDVGPSGESETWTDWLTTDWSDAPGATLIASTISIGGFSGIGQELSFKKGQTTIDPTQVASSPVNFATSYSTQRKVVAYGGTYYLFVYTGSNIVYMTSRDQVTWSDTFVAGGGTGYGGAIGYNFDLYQTGPTIALTWLYYNSSASGDRTTALYFVKGVLFQGDVSWSNPVKVAGWSQPFSWPPSVTIGTDGTFWTAGIWQDTNGKYNIWIYSSPDGSTFGLSTHYFTSDNGGTRYDALQLEPLIQGKIMALTSHYADTGLRWTIWNPLSSGGPSWSSIQSFNLYLASNTYKWNLIAATSTTDGYVHILTASPTAYAYYNSTSGGWTYSTLYSGYGLYPSISADTLGNLYAFWLATPSGPPNQIWYQVKPKGQSWLQAMQIFGTGSAIYNATWLSVARLSSKEVIIAWTLSTPSPYAIFFGSIPLPSGIASGPPSRPWSSLGLTPNEQYFTQNGEYVSPGNGLLTVSQTDISVQGRNGLNLAITRVYVEPFTFVQGIPLNYETSPYSNLGPGWRLNIPWVGTQNLHYLNGETFPLIWTSYNRTSNIWALENHQTEDFILTKTTSGYTLSTKDSTTYNFNNNGILTSLTDRTGQNQITLSYTGSTLSSITDTVGRTATLKYNTSNQLANVTYGGQTVKYNYSGSNLVTVTDAVGRTLTLKYTGPNSWLLTGVMYVAGGNSTYTYGSMPVGTDALNYYVILQNVYNPGSVVKTSSFSYNITDGEVSNVGVKQSDGFAVQGYTNYAFNIKSSSLTRTMLNGTQIQMMKTQFWYDPVTSRSVQQDIYSGTSVNRSFFNSQFFDLWGNIIYTRDNTGHESYQSFANTNDQWMFQSPGSLSTTTNGKISYDDFNGPSLNTTAWVQGGSGANKATTVSNSILKLQAASSTQGIWQSNWIRTIGTTSYPFYAEVQMQNWYGPGTSTISADLYISPTAIASNGNPSDATNYLRFSLQDLPSYNIYDRVSGGSQNSLWTSTDTGTQSISWKIVLTDRNTLSVYLNRGYRIGYNLEYATTSLGLSSSFTPSYIYLSFANKNTNTYYATFDYVGLSTSNSLTMTNLQSNQRVELYDWNSVLQTSGTVASGQTSLTLDATQMPFPYGYFKVYNLDGRTVQFTSPTREVWGGSSYSYTAPFKSGGNTRTSAGFLQSTTDYVDDNVPTGATAYADGGDAWAWATSGLGPVVSGTQSHVGFVAAGTHEHYFNGSSATITPGSGTYLIQYVYIPSISVPSEIMLQFHTVAGNWEHRAYWGTNSITACGTTGSTCGTNGTPSRLSMGALPTLQNAWIELIVKADDVGVNGLTINGWAYTLYNGGVFWDYSALGSSSAGSITINSLLAGQKVELYDSTGTLRTSATVASGQASVTLNVYSVGINTFPFNGYMKTYSASGGLQYSSPLTTDIWGGDVYSYNQPSFSNSFNPGPVGSSIHNDRIGSAQYQNATSTPEQDYANYDALGNLLQDSQIHNGSPLTTTYTFDTYGNKISMVNPDNEKTYYTYLPAYQHGYLTNATQVLTSSINATTSYTYNFATGTTLTVKDPMGNVTSYRYDSIERITSIKHPAVSGVASNMTLIFEDARNSFGVQNEKINYTDFNYDGLNRITQVSTYQGALDASPIISQLNYTYNWQNQAKTVQDPTGNVTSFSYDYLARLIAVTNPDGSTRRVSYDDVNLIQTNYDENSHRIDHMFDSLQRLIGIREFYSSGSYYSTSYAYDGKNNLAKTVDAKGQVTTYTYDDLNRLVMTVFPDGFNETRTYDAVSNMISRKDPNGNTIGYGYDALNRLVNITYRDSTKATYTYDKNGNRLTLAYLGNTATFSYDSRNRESNETWTIGGSQYPLSYTYDQVGNIASVTYPDGIRVSYSIDPMNRATTIKTGSTTLATIAYTANNEIANETYGNGVQTTYHYDKRGRPTEIKVIQGQATLLDLNYGYDGVGNILNLNADSYSYDYLNRLVVGTGAWGTIKYGYDGVGNRLWIYQSPTNTTYNYGMYDRLSSAGSTSYSYDNNGNRLTAVSGATTTNYNFDSENRLTSVSQGSSTIGNYTYSPLSLRIKKVESGVTTVYVNSGISVLYEKIGTTINDYVFAGSLIIAKLTGASVFYFSQDVLTSTRLVTTGGTTSFSTNYQPFGLQYGTSGTDPGYKFVGRPQDSGTGLYYAGSRYYDVGLGRFLTRHLAVEAVVDPDTLNPYLYQRNNPETPNPPTGACLRCINSFTVFNFITTVLHIATPQGPGWTWTCGIYGCAISFNHGEGDLLSFLLGWFGTGIGTVIAILAYIDILGALASTVAGIVIAVGVSLISTLDYICGNNGYYLYEWNNGGGFWGGCNPVPCYFGGGGGCYSGGGGGYGGGCVAKNTPILTDHGYVPVQSLRQGDIIMAYDLRTGRMVPVHLLSITMTWEDSLTSINNGALLLTSINQPIYVHNSSYTGWERNPQNLKVGDLIYDPLNHSWVSVVNVQAQHEDTMVYDIVDESPKTFIANGYLLLDK